MADNVEISMSSKDQQVVKTLQSIERAVDKVGQRLGEVEKKSKSAGDATKNSFGDAAKEVGKFVTAVTGIGSVIGGVLVAVNQLKREYQDMKDRQKSAGDKQVEFGDTLREAVRSSGTGAATIPGPEMEKITRGIGERTGIGGTKANQVVAGVLSAKGPNTKAEALAVMPFAESAAAFAPELPVKGIQGLGVSAVDIARGTNATPEQAIGFIQGVAGLAHVTSLDDIVENVGPGLANLSMRGVPRDIAGSLVTAITKFSADPTGRISKTGGLQLISQLQDRYGRLADMAGVIEKIRSDPKERERFFDTGGMFPKGKFAKASFEAGTESAIYQILTGGSEAAREELAGRATLRGSSGNVFTEGLRSYDVLRTQLNSTPNLIAGNLRRTLGASAEELRLIDEKGGQSGILRESLNDLLSAGGINLTKREIEGFGFDINTQLGTTSAIQQAANVSRRIAANKRLGTTAVLGDSSGLISPEVRVEPPTEFALKQADVMERVAKALEKILETQNSPQPQKVIDVTPRPETTTRPPASALSRPP